MIIKCPECELQVSDKALSCPHCGYPMISSVVHTKQRKMNRRRRLPNGFGQISEIKNRNLRNPFRAMVTVAKTESGKPICKPLKPISYFRTYNDAYTALVEYNKNPYDLDSEITVQRLYEKWSQEHFNTLKTRDSAKAYDAAWKYCSSVYDMRAADLRARHIKGCIYEGSALVKGEYQHATSIMKNRIKSIFNMMLDYALEYEIVDKNYSRSFNLSDEVIKDVTIAKKSHIAFTDEEISLLWDNVGKYQCVDAILIQCYSGWRPSELGAIQLENVDLKDWTIMGGMKTPSGINRMVPIHTKIRPLILQRYEQAQNEGSNYLFNWIDHKKDNRVQRFTYTRYLQDFTDLKHEIPISSEHRLHDGRTHFITTAKKFGVDEYAIKYLVGHKISDITEKIYTKREFIWLKEEIEKIK